MTYEIYRTIFQVCAILSGIMLIVSIIVFVKYRIPTVIGDLTGRNARKAIENIRSQNENSGDKTYKSSPVNLERGKLTDKISPSGSLLKRHTDMMGGAMATAKISTQVLTQEAQIAHSQSEMNETTLLTEANMVSDETAVLSQDLLQEPVIPTSVFEIEFEITYIHSNEVIA